MSANWEAVACPSDEGATIHHLRWCVALCRGHVRCPYGQRKADGHRASCVLRKADDFAPHQSSQGMLRFPCAGCRQLPTFCGLAGRKNLVLHKLFPSDKF